MEKGLAMLNQSGLDFMVAQTMGEAAQKISELVNNELVKDVTMSILVGKDSRVLVQGITGREGSFHTQTDG